MQERNSSMHLTRPKSSKGRSRPAASASVCAGDTDGSTQRPPEPPDSPVHTLRSQSQSQPAMWQAGQLSQDQVLQVLQHTSCRPSTVPEQVQGPSIHREEEQEVRPKESEAPMVHAATWDLSVRPRPPDSGPTEAKEGGTLLLAIRTPCGRRFQQHFDPSDTLLAVRASAEVRYGARYRQAFIQTMEVPRRTFTDLDLTLGQCGVPNRSVLCISQGDSVAEQD
ncbi:hypothetical protein L3Q82_016158 [Scortum barcoo]|uniref:Uncharacterized protein n=1 Tax=Scortum barcoo TaxID=214431 RepID=A0ACB8VTB0_9TELE|nr:hypothetical protein L3Q82_016158 [Scortum barcoo]